MLLPFNTDIWLYQNPIDFRKQMGGLIMLVSDHLKLNPTSGQIFLFRNKHANKIKLLWWYKNGFWLCYKRLEQGRLKFTAKSDIAMLLTTEQFGEKQHSVSSVKAANSYPGCR